MNAVQQNLSHGTIEITITIPWAQVKEKYREIVDRLVQNAEEPGFRKGKVPKKIAEEKLDSAKVYEEVIQSLLPHAYSQAVKTLGLSPIVVPKVELKQAKEGSDWVVRALTCQKPTLTLKDYRNAILEAKKGKQKSIWVPGSDKTKEEDEAKGKASLDELVAAILAGIECEVPELLIEREVNQELSALIDQTKKLGLTVEQYLASTQRTAEGVRREYEAQAQKTLSLEFGLEAIADKEGIFVTDDDITKVIDSAKTEEEKQSLSKERYYLASILRRQKTLDFLASL